MVAFYVLRITNGTKKWTDVPVLWRDKVINMLKEKGYTLNEDGTVSM